MIQDVTEPTMLGLLSSEPLVMVAVTAPWCGACKQLEPQLERFSQRGHGVYVARLNADHAQWTIQQYGIRGLPTLLLFERGHLVAQTVAAGYSASQIASWIG